MELGLGPTVAVSETDVAVESEVTFLSGTVWLWRCVTSPAKTLLHVPRVRAVYCKYRSCSSCNAAGYPPMVLQCASHNPWGNIMVSSSSSTSRLISVRRLNQSANIRTLRMFRLEAFLRGAVSWFVPAQGQRPTSRDRWSLWRRLGEDRLDLTRRTVFVLIASLRRPLRLREAEGIHVDRAYRRSHGMPSLCTFPV